MKVDNNTLREMVKEVLSELDESDLVVRSDDGRTWQEVSAELKTDVDNMISHITADRYQEALEDISGISATMKIWRRRIMMGGAKAKKPGEAYDLSRFDLGNTSSS